MDYADYIGSHRLTNEMPHNNYPIKIELASVDTAKHKIVSVSIQDTDGYDRTEILNGMALTGFYKKRKTLLYSLTIG